MKKSLFVKYFTVSSVVILSSFVFLGCMFSLLISKHLTNERQEMLSGNVSKAVDFTIFSYEVNGNGYLEKKVLRQFYASLADVANGVMFYTDVDGNTIICTEEGVCSHELNKVSKNILLSMSANKNYVEYGRLGNIYKSTHYTVGRPIYVNDGTVLIGYLFSSASADSLSTLINDIFKIFLMASISAIFLTSILIYVATSILSRPLKQMSNAAKSFGRGDFSVRVSYHSNDEIGELASSFNQMADSLAELEMTRSNFISNVSHELKTPMTTIGGFVDGILDGTISKDNQEYYLKLVSDEIKRLSRLVKSMLNIAKIDAGETKLNLACFDISDLIIKTLFNFETRIEEKKLDIKGLETLEKTFVYADEDLVHQVIYNLVDNAIKFCNIEGYLEFSVLKENGKAYIHVINSGNGLSRYEINHVFDRFYKTDKSRGLDKSGVGLGLNIVKSIIDMHHGEITVGSIQGQYTEFIFSLAQYSDGADKK